jgi:putative transposase
MTSYDPQKHHRRTMRLNGYDYAQPGAYFITLVTFQREELFGQVVNGEIQLSTLGQIVHDEWMRSICIRREIHLNEDEFIIMPNHIHGIVWIVGADGVRPKNGIRPGDIVHPENNFLPIDGLIQGARLAPLQRKPRSLSSFVAGFKARVTSRADHELNMPGIWQRNYYDHIIRNYQDFMNIWGYIDTNPQRWLEDQLHPSQQVKTFNQD